MGILMSLACPRYRLELARISMVLVTVILVPCLAFPMEASIANCQSSRHRHLQTVSFRPPHEGATATPVVPEEEGYRLSTPRKVTLISMAVDPMSRGD